MNVPTEAITSFAVAAMSSSFPAKWYEISRVLDRPARSAIRENEARPYPSSAITSIVAVMIGVRRAAAAGDGPAWVTRTGKRLPMQVTQCKPQGRRRGSSAAQAAAPAWADAVNTLHPVTTAEPDA